MPYLKPSDIRYSQDSIAYHFKNDTKRIGETLDDLLLKRTTLDDIPYINVCRQNYLTFTKDNRRLWVFKKLEELGECEKNFVHWSSGRIADHKFTTKNDGTSIQVRGDPGGSAWRTWKTAKMNENQNPGNERYGSSPSYRNEILRRQIPRETYEQVYEEATSALSNVLVGQPASVSLDLVSKLSPKDVGFCQMRNAIYGHKLGEGLDELLLANALKITCSLDIFYHNGRYYTEDCNKLWVLKILEKFRKNLDVSFTIKNRRFDSDHGVLYLSDSLNISTPIGGIHLKKSESLSNLPTLEVRSLLVSEIFFTVPAISDIFRGNSIAKILVDSFSKMALPESLKVIEYNGYFYALDNELLWVVKEMEKIKGCLEVSVEVKMQMDGALFSNFTSDKIKKVDITISSDRHTDEESFIIQYIKKVSL